MGRILSWLPKKRYCISSGVDFFGRGFLRALPECRHCWVRFSDDASPLIFAK